MLEHRHVIYQSNQKGVYKKIGQSSGVLDLIILSLRRDRGNLHPTDFYFFFYSHHSIQLRLQFTLATTMAANKDMINASMVEAGFCINKHGGAYENVWRQEAIEGGGAIQS